MARGFVFLIIPGLVGAFLVGVRVLSADGPTLKVEPTDPQHNRYVIDSTPAMPRITAVVSGPSQPGTSPSFAWTVHLSINMKARNRSNSGCATGAEVTFDKDFVQNATAVLGQPLEVGFKRGVFRGGRLKLVSSGSLNNVQVRLETPDGLRIDGLNPGRRHIQEAIDDEIPPSGVGGLRQTDIQDAIKRMACRESGQRQFDARPEGGAGPEYVACDNGVGVLQITHTNRCRHPFADCPDVIFNWRENIAIAVRNLEDKVEVARQYPSIVRINPKYAEFIARSINPHRVDLGLRPLPVTPPPVPEFFSDGRIGSPNPNQLLEDAIRGYNGFLGTDPLFGLPLHEFTIDTDFLIHVPDEAVEGLNRNPRVWRRVGPPERRPERGDPLYVNNVINKSPGCGL